jgi:hypothetical protein
VERVATDCLLSIRRPYIQNININLEDIACSHLQPFCCLTSGVSAFLSLHVGQDWLELNVNEAPGPDIILTGLAGPPPRRQEGAGRH